MRRGRTARAVNRSQLGYEVTQNVVSGVHGVLLSEFRQLYVAIAYPVARKEGR